jgi:hypothetical protein
MLHLFLPQHNIVPAILKEVKFREEAVTCIITVDVNDATGSAGWDVQGTHPRIILKMTLKIVLKKRMKRALTRVSRRKMVTVLAHP